MRKLPVQRGFTLLEFLVVLVIIVVLVLILWPVYSSGPHGGQRISCQSNLKQVTTALLMYTQDYDDRVAPFANGSMASPTKLPALLHPYLKNRAVWRCPYDERAAQGFDLTPADGSVDYGYNWLALSPAGVGVLLWEIPQPAETVALVDASSYLAVPTPLAGGGGASAPNARHGETTAVSWMDGHVKWMRREVLDRTAGEENGQRLGVGIDGFVYWNLK
jgi:prepilin-type N-terminal cleavage/methylation domain-containing protein/prepilin-type processing-associated H-X9-DG protein